MVVEENIAGKPTYRNVAKLQNAHGRGIAGVDFIVDAEEGEQRLVTCAFDNIKCWTLAEGSSASIDEVSVHHGYRHGVQGFDVASDGKEVIVVVVGVDSTLSRFIMPDFSAPSTCKGFNLGMMEAWHVRITPDCKHLITIGHSGFLKLVDLDGTVVRSSPINGIRQTCAVAISNDGNTIALANNDGVVTVVDFATFTTRFYFEAHALMVRAICFSPDSKRLLTGADDRIVKLFDVSGSKMTHLSTYCGHRGYIMAVKFDRCFDGQRFASATSNGTVVLWDVSSSRPLHMFENAHEGVVSGLSFSYDSEYLASVGHDRTICVHCVNDGPRRSAVSPSVRYEVGDGILHGGTSHDTNSNSHNADGNNMEYTPTPLNGFEGLEEDDELLARARRDLEDGEDEGE